MSEPGPSTGSLYSYKEPLAEKPLGSVPLGSGRVANACCETVGLAYAVLAILLAIEIERLSELYGRVAGQIILFSPVLSMAARGIRYSTIQVASRGPPRYPAGAPGTLEGPFASGVAGS